MMNRFIQSECGDPGISTCPNFFELRNRSIEAAQRRWSGFGPITISLIASPPQVLMKGMSM